MDDVFEIKDLCDYNIVYNARCGYAVKLAQDLCAWIGEKWGRAPVMVPDQEPAAEKEIILGDACREENKALYCGDDALQAMECMIAAENGKIVIAGAGAYSTEQAAALFKHHVEAHRSIPTVRCSLLEAFPACRGSVRLMQYNILAGLPGYGRGVIIEDENYRKEMLAPIILGHDPDILVLNEFYDTWALILPQLLEQQYGYVALQRKDGTTNYNLLLYKLQRFELVASGYEDIQVVQHKHKRAVVWAVLRDKEIGKRFQVFGTHLDHHGHGDLDQRRRQVCLLKMAMDKVAAQYTGTQVLMGDLNTRPGEPIYQEIKMQTGLHNAMEETGGIDCCFLDSSVAVTATYVDQGHHTAAASDHKPIVIDITYY